MKLLTYCNKEGEGLNLYRQTAAQYGWEPIILGAGDTHFTWEVRMRAVRDYCDRMDPREIVLFTDAFDVLLLAGPEKVEVEFLKFDKSIVFSAETNCYPLPSLATKYPACETAFKYLNAGTYIGRAVGIARMMTSLDLDGAYNLHDQQELSIFFLKHPEWAALDTGCKIFQCLYGAEHLVEVKDGRLRNKQTGTFPLVLHANGNHANRRTAHYHRLLFESH